MQLLYLNWPVDKVLIIAEVHAVPQRTKANDNFDALCHYRCGTGDRTYSCYWSSKWPSASCETPICKPGTFHIILTITPLFY